MPIVVSLSWPHVTPDDYEALDELIRYEEDPPVGAISHTAWFTESGLRVVDVWRTREDFKCFAEDRLMPSALEVPGFHGEPLVKFHRLHAHVLAPPRPASSRDLRRALRIEVREPSTRSGRYAAARAAGSSKR